jgi:hypothetical protein
MCVNEIIYNSNETGHLCKYNSGVRIFRFMTHPIHPEIHFHYPVSYKMKVGFDIELLPPPKICIRTNEYPA